MSTETELFPSELGMAVLEGPLSAMRSVTDLFEKETDYTFSRLDAWREELDEFENRLADEHAALRRESTEIKQVDHEYREKSDREIISLQTDLEAAEQRLHEEHALRDQQQSAESDATQKKQEELTTASQNLLSAQDQICDNESDLKEAQDESLRLEKEIVLLENELEKVRDSSVELSDRHAEIKEQFAMEKAQWAEELSQVRRTLEIEAKAASKTEIAGKEESPVRASMEADGANTAQPGDRIVGRVMAQFQKLKSQQTRQRRNGKH